MTDPLSGALLGERYLVRGLLGEGGAARIYDALDVKVGRELAVKILQPHRRTDEDARQRLLREGRVAAGIRHPNVCAITDVGALHDGTPYLVMERMDGSSLAGHLARVGALAPRAMVDIVAQVASALTVAHGLGIVHRDVKPANVFLAHVPGRLPVAKLLDFGSALLLRESSLRGPVDEVKLTATGIVIGTPRYMAPEQATGEANLDERTDVYACGVLLYEGISGRRPFQAQQYAALLLEIASRTPVSLSSLCPGLSPALGDVVSRAMARDRSRRYPSAAALLGELQNVEASLSDGVVAEPENWDVPTVPGRHGDPKRR